MPATAHGLQDRFNARTVTKRKYPGSAPVPVEPALPNLWHGPVRSLSFTKTVFSEIRGHGGSVTQRVPLRIWVSFYSIFNLHEACRTSGHCDPKCFASHKPFHFPAQIGTYYKEFFKIFSKRRRPRSIATRTTFSWTPSARAMSCLVMPRMK